MANFSIFDIVVFFISIFILVKIYHYLSQLDHCQCFQIQKNQHYKIDIEFMKFYQVLEIFSFTIFFLSTILLKKHSKMNGGSRSTLRFINALSFIILLYIFGYMTYNVFHFFVNMKNECKCANKWQKYFIYAQGIGTSLATLQMVFGFLLSISIISSTLKK